MFTIAVCDDDMQERMQEVQIVKNIFSQKELEAGIEEFQTGQHFLDVLHRVPYDIVLLDIQMGEVSGFTLAEELYKITGGENIIFVSSMENLVFESIHFRPFRFVRKSHLEEELTEAVESWIQQNTKTECLEFDETGGVTTILPQQEIIYIEVQSHHLYVHTQKEVLKVRGKISDFAYLAETGDFFMSTLFYLCNMKYIYEIQRDTERVITKLSESAEENLKCVAYATCGISEKWETVCTDRKEGKSVKYNSRADYKPG